ncbi:MAG TPA: hypothetical protein VFQ25_04885 [Ktedonobacterales bacterium]|nr:hypothetical protein [Ktedonobacterales bacterium]
MRYRAGGAFGAVGLLVALAGACAYMMLRRLGNRWGATDAETREPLPGDEMVPHPVVQTTHAVTIGAPVAEVWPWLVQMGYTRAGWYTNDWWYRLVDRYIWRTDMPRVARILPELQRLAVGDVIPDGPPGSAYFTVIALEPQRTLALYSTTHGTVWLPRALRDNPRLGVHSELGWVFVLRAPAPDTTRLILRTRGTGGPALYRALAWALLPPADFLVARMLLVTVKRNVERAAGRWGRRRRQGQSLATTMSRP